MPEKDPMSYALITYAWIIVLSCWGGITGYIRKVRSGQRPFAFAELIGELCISGFVGVITFFMCEAANIPAVFSAAIIGICSHMGSRAIFLMEVVGEKVIKKWLRIHD